MEGSNTTDGPQLLSAEPGEWFDKFKTHLLLKDAWDLRIQLDKYSNVIRAIDAPVAQDAVDRGLGYGTPVFIDVSLRDEREYPITLDSVHAEVALRKNWVRAHSIVTNPYFTQVERIDTLNQPSRFLIQRDRVFRDKLYAVIPDLGKLDLAWRGMCNHCDIVHFREDNPLVRAMLLNYGVEGLYNRVTHPTRLCPYHWHYLLTGHHLTADAARALNGVAKVLGFLNDLKTHVRWSHAHAEGLALWISTDGNWPSRPTVMMADMWASSKLETDDNENPGFGSPFASKVLLHLACPRPLRPAPPLDAQISARMAELLAGSMPDIDDDSPRPAALPIGHGRSVPPRSPPPRKPPTTRGPGFSQWLQHHTHWVQGHDDEYRAHRRAEGARVFNTRYGGTALQIMGSKTPPSGSSSVPEPNTSTAEPSNMVVRERQLSSGDFSLDRGVRMIGSVLWSEIASLPSSPVIGTSNGNNGLPPSTPTEPRAMRGTRRSPDQATNEKENSH